MQSHRNHAGIEVRHARSCRSRSAGRCNCNPTYQAHVWSQSEGRRIRKTFQTLAAARAWRQDAQVAIRKGAMRAPSPVTVEQAANAWVEGAKDGTIHNRSGDPYKPSVIRRYEIALRLKVIPELGSRRLSDLSALDVQDFTDQLKADGVPASTIRNVLMPLRAIYRRHVARGTVAVNPTRGIELPAVRSNRPQIVAPEQASKLIAALPVGQRALWATALYAGLRRGELMGLDWNDVSLAAGVIRVERGWDTMDGEVGPKSRAGRRKVPIIGALRDHLVEHRMEQSKGLVFGRTPEHAFTPTAIQKWADDAWSAAELERITLHAARHTFASILIDAGVNAKAITTYMGHASITVTFDLYGHLMPGNEDEAAALVDAYLERANTQTRLAVVA